MKNDENNIDNFFAGNLLRYNKFEKTISYKHT